MPKEKLLYERVMEISLEKLMKTPIEELEEAAKLLEYESRQNFSVMLWLKSVIETRRNMN